MLFAPDFRHRFHVSSLAIRISFASRIMPDSLYCGPCRRLLRGDLSIIDKYRSGIYFEHHNDRESLANALRLPCEICSRANSYASKSLSWVDLAPQTRINGYLFYFKQAGVVTLEFKDGDMHELSKYNSTRLAFIPWSGGNHVEWHCVITNCDSRH